MRVALVLLCLSGCAMGYVTPTAVTGLAAGKARLEYVRTYSPEAGLMCAEGGYEERATIRGGWLSGSFGEILGTLAAGAAVWWAGGAL